MLVLVMNSGVLEDTAYADPTAVDPGVIAFFDEAGNNVDLDAAVTTEKFTTGFRVVRGDADQPLMTRFLEYDNIHEVIKRAYVAPTKQVTTISNITPANGYAAVGILDMTLGAQDHLNVTVEVQTASGDTAAQIAARLRDAINGNSRASKVVVASVATNNLVLTAKDFNTSFTTALQGTVEGATRTATTAPSQGNGSAAQVRKLEEKAKFFAEGEQYTDNGLLGSRSQYEYQVDDSKNYNIYTIRYKNNMDIGVNTPMKYEEIYLCIATAGVTGTVDTYLGV